jgi:hypothetical protein
MGFSEGEDTTSLNKELGIGSNGSHSPSKARDPEYTTDPNHPSIAAQKKIATNTNGLALSVETDREGVVILDGGLVPYKKGGLNVAHATKYWSYYAHIRPGMNSSSFPAVTEENVHDFLQRLCSIRQDVLSIGKASFESAIVAAFNQSGHTSRGQPITSTADVEDLMCNWKGSVLSCLQLNWRNIHSLNTENSEFVKETLPMAIVVHGATQDPPYTISDAISDKADTKRRVSNHGLVKLANSACVEVKKKFHHLEEKLFGMSVRTKAGGKQHAHADHYEIEVSFDNQAKGRTKTYILVQKRLFKGGKFSANNPPTEQHLRAHLNSGDEVKILLQAAISRAKKAGISRQVLSSCMDDLYREINCSSSITLPPDLDDVLDLGASIEGESSSIDCFSHDRRLEQHPPPTEISRKWEEHWMIAHQQPWQQEQSRQWQHQQPPKIGLPQQVQFQQPPKIGLQQQVQFLQPMKPHQWNGQQQQFEWRAPQHNEMAQMVNTDQEKWMDPHQRMQKSPGIVLMQRMDQNQQTQHPLQIDPMNDSLRNSIDGRLLEQQAQQLGQQQTQIDMGHDTGRYCLPDELVQPQETPREEQQQTQMTTGQGTNALEFFESSSRRLSSGLQKTAVTDCDDGESKSSLDNGEESINMHQQHSVETILHSKFESNGQQKYLIRWTGDYKDSWQPKGNITSDVIEDFNKRKMQERANEHLAMVSVYSIQCVLLSMSCFTFSCHPHCIHFFFVN